MSRPTRRPLPHPERVGSLRMLAGLLRDGIVAERAALTRTAARHAVDEIPASLTAARHAIGEADEADEPVIAALTEALDALRSLGAREAA